MKKERRHGISNGVKQKFVYDSDLQSYLAAGWHLGNDFDTQKSKHKRWYNNGIEQHTFAADQEIPPGYVPGMLPAPPGRYAKYKHRWYTNGVEQLRLSEERGDIIPEGWRRGQSESMAAKSRNAAKGKHRSEQQKENHRLGAQKAWKKKLERGTFNKSLPEDRIYEFLIKKYGGEKNVVRQYRDVARYPYHADFYIKSLDIFIEVNIFPTHGLEPFDPLCEKHRQLLKKYQESPTSWIEEDMVYTWADLDVRKYQAAKKNNLRYIRIYYADYFQNNWEDFLASEIEKVK